MVQKRAAKSISIAFQGVLLFAVAACIMVFGWNGNVYGENSPDFRWTIDVVYPATADSAVTEETATARAAAFNEMVNNLSADGVGAGLEKFRSDNGDVYRIKSQSATSLKNFRRKLHTEIAKNISLLSGPVRMSISGKTPAAGRLYVVVDSNPSTGYHWKPDISSGAGVTFNKTAFERRAYKYGAPESQTLVFDVKQDGAAQIELVYRRPWRKQDNEIIRLNLETDGALPATMDLSNPYAVKETAPTTSQTSQAREMSQDEASDLPSSYDWRAYHVVPAVRDQGACGSCWAFGTVGIMESALRISGYPLTNLSEQFLISCNSNKWGCDGGLTAHKYHYKKKGKNQTEIGAVLEKAKPYEESDGSCDAAYDHPYILSYWKFIPGDEWTVPTVAQIKNAIYNRGPVTAAVCAGDAFDEYVSGVFSTDENCGGSTNHQIILVGWNDNNGVDVDGYWILRNSWDKDWGESGYMKIKYNTSRVGEGASYVTVKKHRWEITVNAKGGGGGSVVSAPTGITFKYPAATTDSGNYYHGATVKISAKANSVSKATWGGTCKAAGGTVTGNKTRTAVCTINVTKAATVTATFRKQMKI
jgi:C1A family cysteine protease